MQKIESFQIDHTKLKRGIYVSRKDPVGNEMITTFDIRMKEPNKEPVIDIQVSHTIEHLGATFLRNHSTWGEKIIYFGPMGCRTGFYLLLTGNFSSKDIVLLITEMFEYIKQYEGDIPGASREECGNFQDHNLSSAKQEATIFLQEILYHIKEENLVYPA